MISRLRKACRRHRRALPHALVVAGLIPKFLVPVGYMPAALADGGPLMLCDAYRAIAVAEPGGARDRGAVHEPRAPGVHDPDSPSLQHAGHGADPGTPDEDRNTHGEWKRCSLGGLASLATIHADWRIAMLPVGHERVAVTTTIGDTLDARIPFRSRAPPPA